MASNKATTEFYGDVNFFAGTDINEYGPGVLFVNTEVAISGDLGVSGTATINDMDLTGILSVSGAAIINDLTITNTFTAPSISVSGPVTFSELTLTELSVSGPTTLGDLSITGVIIGPVNFNNEIVSNITIDSGTINNTIIGASGPSAAYFTILQGTTGTIDTLTSTDITVTGLIATDATFESLSVSGTTCLNDVKIDGSIIGPIDFNNQSLTNVNIDSGNIDNTIIGTSMPVEGTFTTLTVLGQAYLNDIVMDELCVTGSIKAPLLTGDQITVGNLTVTGTTTLDNTQINGTLGVSGTVTLDDLNVTTAYIDNLTTGTALIESTLSVSGLVTVDTFDATTITADEITTNDITVSGTLSLNDLDASSATLDSLEVLGKTTLNELCVSGAVSMDQADITSLDVVDLSVSGAATLDDLNVTTGYVDNLTGGNVVVQNDISVSGTATLDDLNATVGYIDNLTAGTALIESTLSVSGLVTVDVIDATMITVDDITVVDITVSGTLSLNDLDASSATLDTLEVLGKTTLNEVCVSGAVSMDQADITNLDVTNLDVVDVVVSNDLSVSGTALIDDLNASTGYVDNLTGGNVVVQNDISVSGVAELADLNATIGYIDNLTAGTALIESTLGVSGLVTVDVIDATLMTADDITVVDITVSGILSLNELDASNATLDSLEVLGKTTLNELCVSGVVSMDQMDITDLDAINIITTELTVDNDLHVAGNLTIGGTSTNISTNNLTVDDPLIKLGATNTSDVVDIGFIGCYDIGSFTGLFRDATSGEYRLFNGLLEEPLQTVNIGASGYTPADLILGNLTSNGNIVVTGTVDGRDVSVDGTTLDNHVSNTSNPHSVTIDQVTVTSSKGDILVENGSNVVSFSVGTDGTVLTADSSASAGVTWAPVVSDHGGLTGLLDDDHSQYALLAGRSGGQTLTGGTAANNDLTLISTSHATKGKIQLNSNTAVNDQSYGGFEYDMSVQSGNSNTWLEILNNGGGDAGVFFGIDGNDFELWSYQAGDIKYYVHPTLSGNGANKFTMQKTGEFRIHDLGAGVVKSSSTGVLSYETTNTAFNKNFGTTAGTVAEGSHVSDTANPHSVTMDQVTVTTTKGDLLVEDGANVVRLPVGTTGQLLAVNTSTSTCLEWQDPPDGVTDHTLLTNIGTNTHAQIDTHIASTSNPHSVTMDQVTVTTTKGDLLVENGSNVVRLPVGSDSQILVADSSAAAGVTWATAGAGTDEFVKVSSDDTTTGYLYDKVVLVSRSGLTKSEGNGGSNENLQLDLTAQIKAPDGSKAAPQYSFDNDSDTGMYRESSGDLAFSNDGTCTLEIASNGRVFMSGDVPNYETLVTTNQTFTNKKYVDDQVSTVTIDTITPTTTKGDLLVENGSNVVRLPVGSNNQILVADSAESTGVKWENAGAGTDEFVKVSSDDTTTGYLYDKVVLAARTGFTKSEGNGGSNENLRLDLTAQIKAPDGSTSAPQYSFDNDSNTGMYREGSGDLAFSNDGTCILEIASNGHVFISNEVPNYETLVTTNQTITNKKYVDDEVATVTIDTITPTTTKGDVLVENGSNVVRLGVGSNGQVLTADSAQSTGVKWSSANGQMVYDAIVDDGGDGDYTTIKAAFDAGHKCVFVKRGTYNESGDIIIPDCGSLHGECHTSTICNFTGAYSVVVDGSARRITAGTISITTDTTTVTGSGTTFTTLQAGDFIKINQLYYEIDSITNATSLELLHAFRGSTISSIAFIGQSMFKCCSIKGICVKGTTDNAIRLEQAYNTSIYNVHICDCGAASTASAIYIYRSSECFVEHSFIIDSPYKGFLAKSSTFVSFMDSIVKNSNNNSVELNDCMISNVMNSTILHSNGTGINVTNACSQVGIKNCVVSYCENKGINTDVGTNGSRIAFCEVCNNSTAGIDTDGDKDIIINNLVYETVGDGIWAGTKTLILGNKFMNSTGTGISADNDIESIICNNYVTDNGADGIKATTDTIVSGNLIKDNVGDGIEITASASNAICTGNRIDGNGVGVKINSSASGTMVRNNILTSNTTSITDNGTGTLYDHTIDTLTPTTTKGDILVENGSNVVRLAIGSNDQVLTADSAQSTGVKWATPAAGGSDVKVAIIRDVKSNGTNGGTFTSGAWRERDLNNTNDPDSIVVSLSGNEFTLGAGKYRINVIAPVSEVDFHQCRLYNVSDSSVETYGQVADADVGGTGSIAHLEDIIDIASNKAFRVEHRCSRTESGDGFGRSVGFGNDEVYTIVTITKYG